MTDVLQKISKVIHVGRRIVPVAMSLQIKMRSNYFRTIFTNVLIQAKKPHFVMLQMARCGKQRGSAIFPDGLVMMEKQLFVVFRQNMIGTSMVLVLIALALMKRIIAGFVMEFHQTSL